MAFVAKQSKPQSTDNCFCYNGNVFWYIFLLKMRDQQHITAKPVCRLYVCVFQVCHWVSERRSHRPSAQTAFRFSESCVICDHIISRRWSPDCAGPTDQITDSPCVSNSSIHYSCGYTTNSSFTEHKILCKLLQPSFLRNEKNQDVEYWIRARKNVILKRKLSFNSRCKLRKRFNDWFNKLLFASMFVGKKMLESVYFICQHDLAL